MSKVNHNIGCLIIAVVCAAIDIFLSFAVSRIFSIDFMASFCIAYGIFVLISVVVLILDVSGENDKTD